VVLHYGVVKASPSKPLKIEVENFVGYGLQKSGFSLSQQKIDQYSDFYPFHQTVSI
jgi:hypothetical protein